VITTNCMWVDRRAARDQAVAARDQATDVRTKAESDAADQADVRERRKQLWKEEDVAKRDARKARRKAERTAATPSGRIRRRTRCLRLILLERLQLLTANTHF